MRKGRSRLGRLGVLAPAALSVCIDASVLAAPAAGAVLSTVLKELSKAFMLKKWFHGDMSAKEAEQLLMQKGKNGSYLVRESQTHPGKYVLSVRVREKVSHVMIRREHNKYNVGSGEIFDDLTGLIEHCRAYPLTKTSGEVLRLRQPVNCAWTKTMSSPTTHQSEKDAVGAVEPNSGQQHDELSEPEENVAGATALVPNNHFLDYKDYDLEENLALHASQDVFEIDQMMGYMGLEDAVGYFDESPQNNAPEPMELPVEAKEVDSIKLEFLAICEVDRITPFTTIEARTQENHSKNRFSNVIPYDQNRVILPEVFLSEEEYFNDYINASYIKPQWTMSEALNINNSFEPFNAAQHSAHSAKLGPILKTTTSHSSKSNIASRMDHKINTETSITNRFEVVKDKFYIATQGCLWSTKFSFWLMIIHEDIRVIAMITKLSENGMNKCEMYWPPQSQREIVGNIEVFTVAEYYHPFYMAREIQLRTPQGKIHTVYHYQFENWPDNFIPNETKEILRFIRDVNARMYIVQEQKSNAPLKNILCVHCSAGIGRTGAFIAIDMMIDILKINGIDTPLDVYGVVKKIRSQRAGMVQNKHQYQFIYFAMEEFIMDTKIQAENNFAPVPPYVSY